jgi:hypothetical protein
MDEQEAEDMLGVITRTAGREWAGMIVLAIGIAARAEPEMVRKALASVFDLQAVEDCTQRMMVAVSKCQAALDELRVQYRQLQVDLEATRREANVVPLNGRPK